MNEVSALLAATREEGCGHRREGDGVDELPAELTELNKTVSTKVQALVAEVPAQVQALPVTVRTNVEKVTEQATDLYNKLTVRG